MCETVPELPRPSAPPAVSSSQLEESHTLHLCTWQHTAQRLAPTLLCITQMEPVCGMPQAIKAGRDPNAVRARKRLAHTKVSSGQQQTGTRPTEVPVFVQPQTCNWDPQVTLATNEQTRV